MTQEIEDAVHLAKKITRFRTQEGTLVLRSTGWWIGFYDWDEKGSGRKKVYRYLCQSGIEKRELDQQRRAFMKKINNLQRGEYTPPDPKETTVGQYFVTKYLPLIDANRSVSTSRTYKNRWKTYCADHFAKKVLTRYETVDANKFLTDLAQRKLPSGVMGLNRNSLALVRGICSGLFSLAQNEGLIDRNPFTDVRLLVKIRKPSKSVFYSWAEVAEVLNATVDDKPMRTDAKIVFLLCALRGLRPAEAAAVKWSDVHGELLSILRAAPNGVLGETKTESSIGAVTLIEPIISLIKQWNVECGKPKEGFMFKRRNSDTVIDVQEFKRQYIQPYGRKAIGDRWRGLYPGRRGTSNRLRTLTGSNEASSATLRNSPEMIDVHYSERQAEAERKGALLIEQEFKETQQKLLKA
jgi:integrase